MSNKYFSKSDPTAAVSVKDDNVRYAAVQNPISTIKDYTKCFIEWVENNSDIQDLNIISEDISIPPCYKVLSETYMNDVDKGIVRGNKRHVVYPLREKDIQQIKNELINKTLTHIDIPYGTKKIARYKFSGQSLQSVYIPAGVTRIEEDAFWDCSSLKSIKLPDSLTSIDEDVFSGCISLTSIKLPDNLTSIRNGTFNGCSNLTSINIPDKVTSIGICAFIGCSSLTSINIPDKVTSIGDSAFEDCSNLTSINIPNKVTSIGDSAFRDCSSLVSVQCLPETPPMLDSFAFGLTHQDLKIYVPDASIEQYKTATNWKEYDDKIRPLSEAPNE